MHPVRLDATATDGAARTGIATTHRGTYRTPCFMPVGTRGAIKYLSAADYDRPRRRDRAGQHLPPDAAARRRCGRPLRRSRPLLGVGRADADRLRRLPGVLARTRRSTTTASRSPAPTTGPSTASRRSRRWRCRNCSAPTSRWSSTSARRCRARTTSSAGQWIARVRGRRGPARRTAGRIRRCSASSRVASTSRCDGRAPIARWRWTSTATASAGSAWGRPGRRCSRRWPRRSSTSRPTGRAT